MTSPSGQGTYAFEFGDGVVMDGATQEHIKEAAPVLAQYCDVLGVRCQRADHAGQHSAANSSATWAAARKDTVVRSFAKYADVPVINLELNVYHPCQGLGDALTLREQFGKTAGQEVCADLGLPPQAAAHGDPALATARRLRHGLRRHAGLPRGLGPRPGGHGHGAGRAPARQAAR